MDTKSVRFSLRLWNYFVCLLLLIYALSPSGVQIAHAQGVYDTVTSELYRVFVGVNDDTVWATYWNVGVPLTLTVDNDTDPGNGYIYQQTRVTEPMANGSGFGSTSFNLWPLIPPIDLVPDQYVSVTDGTTTKTTRIVHGTFDYVDVQSDVAGGTGPEGRNAQVVVSTGEDEFSLDITIGADGHWLADFRAAGYDIRYVDWATIDIWDVDMVSTVINLPYPITFGARLEDNSIEAWEWPEGATVSLSVDDPSTTQNPDYITSDVSVRVPGDLGHTLFFKVLSGYDMKVGDVVTLTDGFTTKQHTIRNLTLTGFDLSRDTIYGTADSGQLVNPWACTEDTCAFREETTGTDGTWAANFAIPGDRGFEQDVIDIRPGSWIDVNIRDEDGDITQAGRYISILSVQIPSDLGFVKGTGWPSTPDTIFTLTIDAPATPDPVDYTRSSDTPQFDLVDFSLQPGFTVTLTDGTTTRSVVVIDQSITNVDVQSSLVKGITTSSLPMVVIARCNNVQYVRHLMPTAGVEWTVDFSVPGSEPDAQTTVALDYACNVRAIQTYPDGNISAYVWPYRSGSQADPMNDWVSAEFWPPGTQLELWINDHYIASLVMPPPDENGISVMLFDLDDYDLKMNDLVSIFAGTYELSYVVEYLEITAVDLEHDLVYGVAEPNDEVIVFANENGSWETYGVRYITADEAGEWSVDFSQPVSGGSYEEQFTIDITTASGVAADLSGNTEVSWPTQKTRTIDNSGGIIFTPNANLQVPADALTSAVEFNILEGGGGYELSTNQGTATVIFSATITPHGTVFDPPATLTFSWDDADSDGIVDNTSLQEADLLLVKDGTVITPACDINPGCNMTTNELTVEVGSLSLFALVVPMDTTPPTITWTGNIHEGDSYYFGFVPSEPTCTASDDLSGVNGICAVSGYASTLGTHTLTATARDNAGNIVTETRSYTVLAWTLKGFYQPVDMNGVYNLVKGGSAVPLKFEIFAGSTELTDTAYIKGFIYAQTSCDANAITDEIETTATGDTSLRYDSSAGQFIYNWKTPQNAGKCYRLTMTTIDGSSLLAYFKLK